MKRPNILWICSDQQRRDTLGCYGNAMVHSPNLDRLAAGGMRFDNCFSQSPVCSPARAAFLTGRYPRTCRMRQNGADIPADEVLVTKMLADAGYVCGLSGKLHLSACHPRVRTTVERRIDDGYAEFHWSHDCGSGWGLDNEYYRWLDDKGAKFANLPHPETEHIKIGPPSELHQTTWCAEKAVDFITARAGGEAPWLFSVNMFDPHHTFNAPAEYLARYEDRLDEIPLPNYVAGELADKPACQLLDHAGPYGGHAEPYVNLTDREHRLIRASYWAMCDLIDDQVGRMLGALDATAQRDNTLVIYTSDHGEMLGDHGIYLKGPYFYDVAVRVPLVVAMGGTVAPGVCPALVELMDLAQTILDAAGLEHHPGMQGRSLWPMLTGLARADHHRDEVYCEYYNAMGWHREPTAQTTMVRTERYKITVDHSRSTGELYDLHADPLETHNRWNDESYASVKTDMLVRLCNRMAWTVDPLPERLGEW